jgi:hypothetical protein
MTTEVLLGSTCIVFDRAVTAEAVCEGFWTLYRGLSIGEELLQSHLLEARLPELEPGPGTVRVRYFHDRPERRIGITIGGRHASAEHLWRYFSGLALDGLRPALERATEVRFPGDRCDVLEVDRYDNLAFTSRQGFSWISGLPSD